MGPGQPRTKSIIDESETLPKNQTKLCDRLLRSHDALAQISSTAQGIVIRFPNSTNVIKQPFDTGADMDEAEDGAPGQAHGHGPVPRCPRGLTSACA